MEPLFLPVLHSFENNNIFTGSFGALRFRVTPSIVMLNQKEVNFDESSMKCECWHGEYCYEKSQMEDEKVFPLSEPARQEMYDWLMAHVYAQKRPAGLPGVRHIPDQRAAGRMKEKRRTARRPG